MGGDDEGGPIAVMGAEVRRIHGSVTGRWLTLGGAWIGNVHRYDGRWVASVPGEPWNAQIGTAPSMRGAMRLLIARAKGGGR
jgi:hypothetical protein